MKKSYIISILLFSIVGCDGIVNGQQEIECQLGPCQGAFTGVFEVGTNLNAGITQGGYFIIPFTEEDFRNNLSYFTTIIEANKPTEDFAYNGLYWVTASLSSDTQEIINNTIVRIGDWQARLNTGSVFNPAYGDKGTPLKHKLASRAIIGPITRGMVERGDTLRIVMKTEYEYQAPVYTEARIILQPPRASRKIYN